MNRYQAKIFKAAGAKIMAAKLPISAESVQEARCCAKEIVQKFPAKLSYEEITDNIEIEQTG